MALTRSGTWIELLLGERVEEFNERARTEPPDLQEADLRMADLRRVDLRRANLRGAYLRGADLRGVDLLEAEMDGASINEARISGALFPRNISADEITLSVWKGTRMRTGRA